MSSIHHGGAHQRVEAGPPSLRDRVAKAFAFSMLGNAGARLCFTIAILVVIRVISTEQFGVANIVLAIFAITESINEMGLGVALVQKKDLDKEHVSALFWLSLLISLLLYPLIFFLAPLLAYFYEVGQLTPLIRVYGLVLLLYALNLVPRNMLVKNLEFKRLALIDNLAMFMSSAVMIGFAYEGYGAWAIVLGDITNRAFQLFGCYISKPFVPLFNFQFGKIKDMFVFGVYATGSRLLYNLYTHADYLVVGKVFGAEVLGVYTLAYRLIADPVRTFAGIVNQVAYPTFSKLQAERERLKKYFFTISRFSLLAVGSLLVTIVVFIDWVLSAGGYEKWIDAVPIAYIFAGVGLIRAISPLIPQLLNSVNRAKKNFIYSLCMAVVMPAGFLLASRYSVMAVAWSWTLLYPFMVSILVFYGAAVLRLSVLEFLLRFFSSLPLLGLVALSALALRFSLSGLYGRYPLPATLAAVLGTLLCAGAILFLKEKRLIMGIIRKDQHVV